MRVVFDFILKSQRYNVSSDCAWSCKSLEQDMASVLSRGYLLRPSLIVAAALDAGWSVESANSLYDAIRNAFGTQVKEMNSCPQVIFNQLVQLQAM
jgi:hypothetical protein